MANHVKGNRATTRRRPIRSPAVAVAALAVVVGSAVVAGCEVGDGSRSPVSQSGSPPPTDTARALVEKPDFTRVVGHRGPRVPEDLRAPTRDKAQSKLWFADGTWWALLFHTRSGTTQIHRLDARRQVWRTTGVVVDTRDGSRADVLWDGRKLYVATGTVYESGWKSPPSRDAVRDGSAMLQRFSYLPRSKSYQLDGGFPAQIHDGASESLVLAKDSTGQLWVTYTRGGSVFVNRTTGDDTSWGTPFALLGAAARINSDDSSALVAFGGDQVGVFWSNQNDRTFYFAVHDDSAADGAWRTEIAYGQGVAGCARGCANDHMSLKALPDGRVFAAVKTANRQPDLPFIVLLVRSTTGWTSHEAGTVKELHTRPLVVLDDERKLVHLLTVVPEEGGAVYSKTSDLDDIEFEPGLGDPFISGGGAINNPTSTKQTVGRESGLVVLASDKSTSRYWYNTQR